MKEIPVKCCWFVVVRFVMKTRHLHFYFFCPEDDYGLVFVGLWVLVVGYRYRLLIVYVWLSLNFPLLVPSFPVRSGSTGRDLE
jgi:hypothetical protein